MVARLYVDVDDTLIKWLDPVEGRTIYQGDQWEINGAVLEYVYNWRESNPDGYVAIWSGGGDDYAHMWWNRIDPDHEIFHFAIGKFRLVPEQCETFIDDMPDWLWFPKTINPRDL